MKNLKSLQVAAVAGLAIALTAGCSSTSSTRSTTFHDGNDPGSRAAYQWSSAAGFAPLTDVRYLGLYPQNWNPVSYENYIFAVKAPEASASVGAAGTTVSGRASSSDVVVTTDSDSGIRTTTTTTQFSTDLQPGDTFVEAAGGAKDGQVRRVILYSPMQGYIGGFAQ